MMPPAAGHGDGASGHGQPPAIVGEFLDAWATADPVRLARVLDERCALTVDSASALSAWSPTAGGAAAGDALIALHAEYPGSRLSAATVNGAPGVVIHRESIVVGVVALSIAFHRIHDIWVVVNPEKLGDWNRRP
jgi:RNA polymerase sigma-70 factor (ECF subfamily)